MENTKINILINTSKIEFRKGTIALCVGKDIIKPYLEQYKHLIPEDFHKHKLTRDGDNYHITIISPKEFNKKIKYDYALVSTEFEILGVGTNCDCYYFVCKYPAAEEYRKSLGLKEHHFHITLGFNKKDVHGIDKSEKTLIIN